MQFNLDFVLFTIMIYIMVSSIVNRICKCIETCSLAKSYPQYLDKIGEKKDQGNGESKKANSRAN